MAWQCSYRKLYWNCDHLPWREYSKAALSRIALLSALRKPGKNSKPAPGRSLCMHWITPMRVAWLRCQNGIPTHAHSLRATYSLLLSQAR